MLTKEDLRGEFRDLTAQLGHLDTKIDGVEHRLSKKLDDVMKHVDELVRHQQKFETELAACQADLKRLGSSSS